MFTFLLAIFRGEQGKNVYDHQNKAYNMLNELIARVAMQRFAHFNRYIDFNICHRRMAFK